MTEYVMVPAEPDEEMLCAGADVWVKQSGHVAQVAGSMYRAILAAAPKREAKP